MMEWHPVFKVGRSRLRVSFTGGHLCGGACTHASFTTSDPVVQAVIEHSEAYKNDKIICITPEEPTVFEYSTQQELFAYLEDKRNVNPDLLKTFDDAKREAARLNITLKMK